MLQAHAFVATQTNHGALCDGVVEPSIDTYPPLLTYEFLGDFEALAVVIHIRSPAGMRVRG